MQQLLPRGITVAKQYVMKTKIIKWFHYFPRYFFNVLEILVRVYMNHYKLQTFFIYNILYENF